MKKHISVIMVCMLSVILSGCNNMLDQGKELLFANKEVTQSVFAMDTYMTITAYGPNAEEAVKESVAEINRLDTLLSTGKETSEITKVNQNHGGKISQDTAFLWKKSREIFEKTDGAFDVTIYPIMKAWGFAGGGFHVPAKEEIEYLLSHVNSGRVQYVETNRQLSLPQGMELDFGGIAKGYTSQRIVEIMKEHQVKNSMINLGGNVQLLGTKPDGSLYRVAVKNPENDGSYLGIIEESDKAVITSGGYERFFEEDGELYHHIIDPKTGYPAKSGLSSVTIVSSDATLADALSTALFVMGKENAVDFWRENSDSFDAVLCLDSGDIWITKGLEKSFVTEKSVKVIDKE